MKNNIVPFAAQSSQERVIRLVPVADQLWRAMDRRKLNAEDSGIVLALMVAEFARKTDDAARTLDAVGGTAAEFIKMFQEQQTPPE